MHQSAGGQRHAALVGTHIQNLRLDFVANGDHLIRPLDPAHGQFLIRNNRLHAFFELDKCAERHESGYLALNDVANVIALADALPRIGKDLAHPERQAPVLQVHLEHHHLDLVVNLDDLAGMVDASPRHLADMQEPVYSPEVHERAVLGNPANDARPLLALGQALKSLGPLLFALFLHRLPVRQDHLAAVAVHFDDLERNGLSDESVQVLRLARADMRRRDEAPNAQVNHKAALDPVGHHRGDDLAVLAGLLHALPGNLEVGALL